MAIPSTGTGRRRVHFVVPGAIDTPTGGYGYDRRVLAGLSVAGWECVHVALTGDYPCLGRAARAVAARILASLPAGGVALIDGLACGALPEAMAQLAQRLTLVALVHHPLGDESGLEAGLAAQLLAQERAALAHAHHVICTSAATASRLTAEFGVAPQRLSIAVPGTDPGPRAAGEGAPPVIVSLGSLIPRKRHDVLITALERIRERAWQARILGSATLDPDCARDLRNRVETCGLTSRIAVEGEVGDARAALGGADLFALASEYEGYGMAFAEALSQGLPVVACRSAAVAELVPQAAGALVPPGDPAAFAAALSRLLDDPAARRACAEAAFAAGARLPSWDETCRRIGAALHTAVALRG